MSEMTPKQQKLVKARKATRVVFALIILGGALLILYGILTLYLPTLENGMVMIASSSLPFILSKKIEKRLATSLT